MQLRPALPSDAEAIAALHAASWRSAYRGALSDEYLAGNVVADRASLWSRRFGAPSTNQHVVVAEVAGRLAGFACAFASEHLEWGSLLDNIHVRSDLQGQGVGTRLLGSIAQWCMTQAPHASLYLWVLQNNHSAQRFYRQLGADIVGTDVWSPPGGGAVPRYRLAWQSVAALAEKAATT